MCYFEQYDNQQYVKSHNVTVNPQADPNQNPELKAFLSNLEARGYFNGVDPSSEEYNVRYVFLLFHFQQRYEKAVSKYLQRKGQNVTAPAPAPAPAPVSEEVINQCEELREQGNACFRRGDFRSALDYYTQAIELSPSNPKKYIYLCNRATAAFYLNDYTVAEKGML